MNKIAGLLVIMVVAFTYCSEEWEDHYEKPESTANVKLWDTLKTMQQYSDFLKYATMFKLDTVIKSSNTKTLFIPNNNAFAEYLKGDTAGFSQTMRYHITPTLFMLRNVEDNYKLQTLEKKFALITNDNFTYYFDNIKISFSSPFFLDGRFYEIDSVAVPKPNLFQYIERFNPAILRYINTQDSVILDKEKSKPIDFNELGQTIYDSVTSIINMYEEEYFAISEEYDNISATIVIPDQLVYETALNEMASVLGGNYNSFEDIPVDWQNNVLIPILLNKGTFGGILEPEDFEKEKITNVRGDSIVLDFSIEPLSRHLCSNGLVYNYSSFEVGDSLYLKKKIEPESYVESIGLGNYVWDEDYITVGGNPSYKPIEQMVLGASNDTVVDVQFDSKYQGAYSLTIKMEHIFANRYRFVWRTNYRTSGIFAVYVNGEKLLLGIGEYEEFDTNNLTSGFFSVLGYKLYPDSKGFCNIDAWVDIKEYGDIFIKLEYLGPGASTYNGLNIDYIELLPEEI